MFLQRECTHTQAPTRTFVLLCAATPSESTWLLGWVLIQIKVLKMKLAQMEFFLFRFEGNKRLGAEKKIVEAPGSNACDRPLLDVINRMMHSSMENLQPTKVEVKWRTEFF